MSSEPRALSHLKSLESESIEIFREVAASFERPVMMYSIGKDSGVMLHLAKKAFYPAPPPFPLLHVDTSWKFKAMYAHRDRMARESGLELIVHRNESAIAAGITPFTHGSSRYTDILKTDALKQALDQHGFDDVDRRLMLTIIEKFGGGPVGLSSLAAATSEEPDAIEDMHEPFLIQIGFLERTPRGRVATRRAYEYFGRPAPGRGLF